MRQMWILAVRYYQHLFLIKLKLRAMGTNIKLYIDDSLILTVVYPAKR